MNDSLDSSSAAPVIRKVESIWPSSIIHFHQMSISLIDRFKSNAKSSLLSLL